MEDQKANDGRTGAISNAPMEIAADGGRRYWRSLEELANDASLATQIANEFSEDAHIWLDPLSRRNFLRGMGASLALAGIVGCSDFPEETILPYVNPPESVVAGKPDYYATTFPFDGYGIGALAQSHEGRPTKLEGNPDHPASLGASNVFLQASILDLYDPDRSRLLLRGGIPSDWGTFTANLRQRLDRHRGKGDGLRLLTRTITSPTLAAQLAEFKQQFPAAQWHAYDPMSRAGCSARQGGAPGQAVHDFSRAGVILSLDADFLFSDIGSIAYARQFSDARRRQPGLAAGKQAMNRLYVVESTFSLTGSMADHRRAVKPSQVLETARAIAARLGVESARGAAVPVGMEAFIDAVANDLRHPEPAPDGTSNPGLVVAGDHLPPAVAALVHAMNEALGSVGKAVRYIEPVEAPGAQTLASLTSDMAGGKVDTLLILGGNPAYDAPGNLREPFRRELTRLTTALDDAGQPAHVTAHLSAYDDETTFCCQWHVPETHYLEAWGDLCAYDGTASLAQPLILPMSGARRSAIELMETILGRPGRSGYEIVRSTWQRRWEAGHHSGAGAQTQPATGASTEAASPDSTPDSKQNAAPSTQPASRDSSSRAQRDAGDFDHWWHGVLRKGVIADSASAAKAAGAGGPAAEPLPSRPGGAGTWELVFRPDPAVWDGQYANNRWLQELPRPFTKLVWDNAALISFASAEKLGVNDKSILRVTLDGRSVDLPVAIVPGLPDETLTLTLGCGRTRGGQTVRNGENDVRGFDAYGLTVDMPVGSIFGASVAVVPGACSDLVATRSHHAMAELSNFRRPKEPLKLAPNAGEHPGMGEEQIEILNRKLVRSATLAEFRADEDWVTKLGGETEMRAKGLSGREPGQKIHLDIYPTNSADGGWDYSNGYQWAMSIDQTACIGCNACVIACQAENNIPVVGKGECARQREMHWIRVDDWFGTHPGQSPDDALHNPQVIHMPVPCMHCENAPCELVCPVGATTHSPEGLNEMTYNRCIGTRYCSNNCPYKVRRFNFLLYSDYASATRALQFNPDVTVRSRGVMEKCTYCVQRLNRTRMEIEKMTLRLEERAAILEQDSPAEAQTLRATLLKNQKQMLDQLQTACQQSCPTEAIVFGVKNDPANRVAKLKSDKLDYALLEDLTTKPRTSYLARLTNPNPALQ